MTGQHVDLDAAQAEGIDALHERAQQELLKSIAHLAEKARNHQNFKAHSVAAQALAEAYERITYRRG